MFVATKLFHKAGEGSGGGGGDQHNLGWYATESALTTAHPTASDGDWAIVGDTDTVWVWDGDTTAWVDSGAGGSGLPDQTGQSGKFLTTDGTDASWSDKPLVNKATQSGSLVVGDNAQSLILDATAFGANAIGWGRYGSAFGKSAVAKYKATALGANTTANEYTIQLGQGGTNSDAGTMKVALTTSSDVTTNYELMSADGTIPAARHAALPAADGTYTLQLVITNGVPTLSWADPELPGIDPASE